MAYWYIKQVALWSKITWLNHLDNWRQVITNLNPEIFDLIIRAARV